MKETWIDFVEKELVFELMSFVFSQGTLVVQIDQFWGRKYLIEFDFCICVAGFAQSDAIGLLREGWGRAEYEVDR